MDDDREEDPPFPLPPWPPPPVEIGRGAGTEAVSTTVPPLLTVAAGVIRRVVGEMGIVLTELTEPGEDEWASAGLRLPLDMTTAQSMTSLAWAAMAGRRGFPLF